MLLLDDCTVETDSEQHNTRKTSAYQFDPRYRESLQVELINNI